MSVQNQITRIQTAVADAYSAVDEMGGTLPQSETVANLADAILTIPQGSSAVTVTEEQDEHGGIIKRINAVSLQGDTVTADTMLAGTTAHDRRGQLVTGTLNSNNVPWQRPAEWPDYSKLHLLENETEAMFFTYDNRMTPVKIGLRANTENTTVDYNYYVDRIRINSDGSITELERAVVRSGEYHRATLPTDAGDYVCIRIMPQEGQHITRIAITSVDGGSNYSYQVQPLVERYGYLPYCTSFGYGSANASWGNQHLVSDTILGMGDNVGTFGGSGYGGYNYSYSLQNLPMEHWSSVPVNLHSFFREAKINSLDLTKVYINTVAVQYMFAGCQAIEELDASSLNFSAVTNVTSLFESMPRLKKIKLPSGFGSALTGQIICFRNDHNLEGVDFPDTFTTGFGANCFNACYNLKYIVIRSETVVPLNNTTNVFNPTIGINAANYYLRFYVPAALIDSYKEATNWATLYTNAGVEIFLPIEGSQFDTTT